jgi:sulfur relay protein TusB/DsrH
LFIEDGVLAVTNSPLCQQLINNYPHIHFYALRADIEARGLTVHDQVSIIDDEGFVELVVTHDSVQSWI